MSALPKAVQRQIDEANKVAEQLQQERIAALQPVAEPAPEPTPPDPAPAAETAPVAEEKKEEAPVEAWEQKYRVLQGKYNAEVPRLQRQLNDLMGRFEQTTQQLTATQNMLASLHQQRSAPTAAQNAAPAASAKLVKDEEVRDFGPDLIDVMRRVAREEVTPVVEKSIQPVKQQLDQVNRTASQAADRSVQTEQERLMSTLDKEMPDWRTLNRDEGFLGWLGQVDPYSGEQRGSLLRQAYERLDIPRVLSFFQGYRKENAVVTPPEAAPAPAPAAAGSQPTLETLVAPGTPKAGTTGAPSTAGKRIWTQPEIKRFYSDCAAGKYARMKDRRDEIERDIFAAQLEGRIR